MTVLHQIPLATITNDEISDAAFRLLCFIAHRSESGIWDEEIDRVTSDLHISARSYFRLKKELLCSSLMNLSEGTRNRFVVSFSLSEPVDVADDFKELPAVRTVKQDRRCDHFQPFYDNYPRKIGRRAAEKAFEAAVNRGVDPELLVERSKVFAQLTTEREADPKFIPHPSTWLNQDRFDDEDLVKVNGHSHGDMAPTTL